MTHSLTPDEPPCGKPDDDADPEYEHAQTVLSAMRPTVAAAAWRVVARRELEAAGTPLTKRAVEIRAADLATKPTDNAADGAA